MQVSKLNLFNPVKHNISGNRIKSNYVIKDTPGDLFISSSEKKLENNISFKRKPNKFRPSEEYKRPLKKTIDKPIAPAIQNASAAKLDPRVNDLLSFLKIDAQKDSTTALNALAQIAVKDTLTGLGNKRVLFVDLEKHSKEMKEQGKSFTIAMFDMDNFKAVNDLLGYDVGDLFIKTVGQEINSAAQEYGYNTYRFGGEEFFVLMPDTDMDLAVKIARKASAKINSNSIMSAYNNQYIDRGNSLIQALEERQAPFEYFKTKIAKCETIEECKKEYVQDDECTDEIMRFMDSQSSTALAEAKAAYLQLLQHALINITDDDSQEFIQARIDSFDPNDDISNLYDNAMKIFSNLHFNKESEIAQISRWLNDFKRTVSGNGTGFKVTAGVKEFTDLTVPVEDYIKDTGAVLSDGKKTLKGEVYY